MFMITLEAARVNKKMTQQQLADALGVHKGTIHNWEHGKTSPDSNQLRKLSRVTNTPMDIIFLPDTLQKVDRTEPA